MLIGRYPALLDANVMHPAFVRGALLWFADERLFQPHWSEDILIEWRRSVMRRFPDVQEARLISQQALMSEAFPDAEVTGYQSFTGCVQLPDPDDQHVLAAAVVGRCAGIVTCNTRDFPDEIVKPLGIEVIHPDDFIVNIIDLHPSRAVSACKQHRAAMAASSPTPEEFLQRYERAGLIQAHQRLSRHVDLL
jgi:predicted nucleic acid-binding protein